MLPTNNAKTIWSATLGLLELEIPRPNFETWLKHTIADSLSDNKLTVYTSSPFAAEMLEKRLYSTISKAVYKISKQNIEIVFKVSNNSRYSQLPEKDTTNEITQDKVKNNESAKLNKYFTFKNFIRGSNNELALAAALKVSENPGKVYNPLYLYSEVGLGKTHLLHSIGHELVKKGKKIIYLTSETFTNEYIKSIREGKTAIFRKKYRNLDALLIDDIQFISTKEQTQEGFFHTFNELHISGKQIIISGDEPSKRIKLQERISSRLSGGLELDIQPPDIETRLAILKHKSNYLDIDNEILEMISEKQYKNIRDLEGSINRIIAYSDLVGKKISLDLAEYAIKNLFSQCSESTINPKQIIHVIEKYTGISIEVIKSNKRDQKSTQARRITMYLLREDAHMTSTAVAQMLGGKDHSTVIYAQKAIEKQIKKDLILREKVAEIRELINVSV